MSIFTQKCECKQNNKNTFHITYNLTVSNILENADLSGMDHVDEAEPLSTV